MVISEICQTEEEKYYITYLWNLKHGASEPIHETEIESGA